MILEDLTVLYAEDEDAIRQTVCDVLELYVDKVITASNGQETLELYEQYKPSVLLLDICMPKKDGLNVLKTIREKDIKTPVIIMTAHTEKEYLMNAVELYITKYLVKPFDKEALISALNSCLELISKKCFDSFDLGDNIFYLPASQAIKKEDELIPLNNKERKLLNLFIKNPNKILTYEQIEYHIWDDYVSKDALKSLIKDLRKKSSKNCIKNISKIGYKLEV